MWTGEGSTNLTEKEKFYECILNSNLKVDFPGIRKDVASYFKDIEEDMDLVEYSPDNINDIRNLFDNILKGKEYGQIKERCVVNLVKKIMDNDTTEEEEQSIINIPEFIYNF